MSFDRLLHAAVITPRGEKIRVISLRRANRREETAAAVRRYRGQRGPQQNPTKELISLRVDRDVVATYRATGSGWQTHANGTLKDDHGVNLSRGGHDSNC